MLEFLDHSEPEHILRIDPLQNNDGAEIITAEETGSLGSPCEFIGLEGSPAASLDRSPEIKTSDESISPGKKRGNKKGNKNGNVEGGDGSEKESKLAEHIANTLRNSLCYDETGSDWYRQTKGLWHVCSEKKALKIIMHALDTNMPYGYGIAKLNNIKSFLMIYLSRQMGEQPPPAPNGKWCA